MIKTRKLHPWNVDPAEARAIQKRLAPRVRLSPIGRQIGLVAGADMAFCRERGLVFGAVVVLGFPDLQPVERAWARMEISFPYVPGLLTFREGLVLLEAIAKLETEPDVFVFDGQGIAHPLRLGLAAHLGLWLEKPSIGCAKSRLVGRYEMPGERKGDSAPLVDGGERIGTVLRTRDSVKPVWVSPGHLADVDGAARLVLACCTRYRLPEPTRLADIEVAQVKREFD